MKGKYIFNDKGEKVSVVLTVNIYNRLIKKLEEYKSRLKDKISRDLELLKTPSDNDIKSLFLKTYKEAATEFKKLYLLHHLKRNKNFQSKTARAVKIHRNTIVMFTKKYGMPRKINKKRSSE